ncbi:DUF6929 family protein [Stigmatella aurantiaca]|uniref:Conserved uncharacterized protein n=1 Tax=Stigmatella aurantiaca (strain DW4/3-1) TaxID=378806 RepID=Q099P3_STIAD|nr:hypothetical protein [Stigmatella aurantiaca]ADO75857.1 conserved uncharacterized protein [Stigmatella aurantiaca DW4/3-1]EAU68407.1 hypothetical protein STIAU_3305 [Stigmatella aurantiaca DW4/3-1]
MIRTTQRRTLLLEAPEEPGRAPHVAAASGLVAVGPWLYVVADDSLHLAVFPRHGAGLGRTVRLFPGELPPEPKARKAAKPDLEALCALEPFAGCPQGALLAVPSGSTAERHRGALLPLAADGTLSGEARPLDFTGLYGHLARQVGPLNIEGAAGVGGRLRLLQRGNGDLGVDALLDLDLERVLRALEAGQAPGADALRAVRRWELGRSGTVRLSFTDAAPLPDGRMVFTAAAEDSRDAYADGAVAGSAVGVMAPDGSPLFLNAVDAKVKLEGVSAWTEPGRIHLLLVADGDDPAAPAPLLEAVLENVPG